MTMIPSEQDYEQVAAWLDGGKVELTAGQRALAEEIAADSSRLGSALDVSPPPGVLHRVHARMQPPQDAHKARRRHGWLVFPAAAAAAAAILLGLLLPQGPTGPHAGRGLSPMEMMNAFLQGPDGNLHEQAEQLGLEIMNCRLALTEEGKDQDLLLAGVQNDLDDLILDQDDTILEDEPEPLLLE
jgi:hypothetical protein